MKWNERELMECSTDFIEELVRIINFRNKHNGK